MFRSGGTLSIKICPSFLRLSVLHVLGEVGLVFHEKRNIVS